MQDTRQHDADLQALRDWALRLGARIDADRPAGRLDCMIFRPDILAANAITRLGVAYPTSIGQLQRYLDHTEATFARFKESESPEADAFLDAMFSLQRRIGVVVQAIADHILVPEAKAQSEITIDEAVDRLNLLRLQGVRYTSVRKLAKQLECGTTTIHNAIGRSPELTAWRDATKPVKTPRAKSYTDLVADSAAATNAPGWLPQDEVDEALRRLIAEASPAERARLNALDETAQQEIARLYWSQFDDDTGTLHKRV